MRFMPFEARWCAVAVALVLTAAARVEAGREVVLELGPAEVRTVTVAAEAGEVVRCVVRMQGVAAAARLKGPDGETLAETAGHADRAVIGMSAEARDSGIHTLVVQAPDESGGTVVVEVSEPDPATAEARRLVDADRAHRAALAAAAI